MLIAQCRSFVTPLLYATRTVSQRSMSTDILDDSTATTTPVERICVVGGGLAGLSVTYHLLQKSRTPLSIDIWDREATVGTGGASAVAGGYVLSESDFSTIVCVHCARCIVRDDPHIFATLDRASLMTTVYITKIAEMIHTHCVLCKTVSLHTTLAQVFVPSSRAFSQTDAPTVSSRQIGALGVGGSVGHQ
jgi:ribulose 1,5-bisphosphate synthetase/thiazole synthase